MANKRFLGRFFAAAIVAVFLAMPASAKEKAPKYVFYMIGDGMGINEVVGTEIYNKATGYGPAQLNFAHFPIRTYITTFSASSLVTDSSAAGTALATGFKTTNNFLGVDPEYNPLSTVAEWAHAAGFGVGITSSVGMNHATPAAFYGHVKDRDSYEEILQQYIDTDAVDFAAGSTILTEGRKTGHTAMDMVKLVKNAGINVMIGHDEFKNLAKEKGRVLCISTNSGDLTPAINRRGGETKLSHFVTAGIEYLYGHFAKKGFFMMVEGGAIDHAGHNDDAAAVFQETTDFAEAIDVVLDFYNKHPKETLIIVTADHETGALMLGSGRYEMSPELLATQKWDESKLTAMYNELKKDRTPSWDEVKDFLKKNLGLWGPIEVSKPEEATLRSLYDREFSSKPGENTVQSLYFITGRLISEAIDYADRQAGFLMPHGTHTGSPVGLYVKGAMASRFLECSDNTDIPKMIKAVAKY